MKKKSMALILALAMVSGLTACGSGSKETASPPAGGTYGVKHAPFLLGRFGNPQATAPPACRRSCRDATGSSTGISAETRTGGNHTKTHP